MNIDTIRDIVTGLILMMLCGIFSWLLRTNKQRILTLTVDLMQKAEVVIQGSKMGAERKALVIAQLEAAGIKVNAWLSAQIDVIVAALNSKGSWLAAQTKETAAGLSDTERKEEKS